MRAFAVHGLSLHEHAVIGAAPLRRSPVPHGDVPEPRPADAWAWRTVALGASFDHEVAHRLAIDTDVPAGDIEAGDFPGEDGIRGQSLESHARGWHHSPRSRTPHATTRDHGHLRRARNREVEPIRRLGTVRSQLRRGCDERHRASSTGNQRSSIR